MANVDTVMLCTNGFSDVVLSGVTVIAVDDDAVMIAFWSARIARFVSKVVKLLFTCPRLEIETFFSAT